MKPNTAEYCEQMKNIWIKVLQFRFAPLEAKVNVSELQGYVHLSFTVGSKKSKISTVVAISKLAEFTYVDKIFDRAIIEFDNAIKRIGIEKIMKSKLPYTQNLK